MHVHPRIRPGLKLEARHMVTPIRAMHLTFAHHYFVGGPITPGTRFEVVRVHMTEGSIELRELDGPATATMRLAPFEFGWLFEFRG